MTLTKEQQIIEANRAAALLNDPLIVGAFSEIERDCIDLWIGGGTAEEREKTWMLLQTLRVFKSKLQSILDNGDFVKRSLEERE